jgi:DNA-directed RNA polymerase subunit RPC12/RpoP
MAKTGHNCLRCESDIEHRIEPLIEGKHDIFTGFSGIVFAGLVNALSSCLMLFCGGRHSYVCESCGQRFRMRTKK